VSKPDETSGTKLPAGATVTSGSGLAATGGWVAGGWVSPPVVAGGPSGALEDARAAAAQVRDDAAGRVPSSSWVSSTTGKMSREPEELARLAAAVAVVAGEVANLKHRLEAIETKMSVLDGRVTALSGRLEALEAEDAMLGRIGSIGLEGLSDRLSDRLERIEDELDLSREIRDAGVEDSSEAGEAGEVSEAGAAEAARLVRAGALTWHAGPLAAPEEGDAYMLIPGLDGPPTASSAEAMVFTSGEWHRIVVTA
jgi:hypothetical protein